MINESNNRALETEINRKLVDEIFEKNQQSQRQSMQRTSVQEKAQFDQQWSPLSAMAYQNVNRQKNSKNKQELPIAPVMIDAGLLRNATQMGQNANLKGMKG